MAIHEQFLIKEFATLQISPTSPLKPHPIWPLTLSSAEGLRAKMFNSWQGMANGSEQTLGANN